MKKKAKKKPRRQHQIEQEAERWLVPPNPDVENPDWFVGAN